MILSLQLYSVREEIKRHGLGKVLSCVKAAGFDGVETAGDYGLGAKGLKKELGKAGLIVTGAHIPYNDIVCKTDAVIEDMRVLEFSDAVIPWISREDLSENMRDIAEKTVAAVKKFGKNGFRLGYHNHKHEFDGGDFTEKYLSAVDGLMFEPDICWLSAAGLVPEEYAARYKGRIIAVHLKELGADESENPVLGQGRAHVAECIRFAAEIGLKYVVAEFECADMPYTEYMEKSVAFIKSELSKLQLDGQ